MRPRYRHSQRDVLHADVGARVGRALARVAELHEPVRHAGDELRRLRREPGGDPSGRA